MMSKMKRDTWLAIFSLLLLCVQVYAARGAVRVEIESQDQPSQKSLPFEVRLIRLADAKTNGYGDSPLSGLILEIENKEPNLSLRIDAKSVKIGTTDGKQHAPLLMFLVGVLKGKVNVVQKETTLIEKEIFIGETSYKALGPENKRAVKMGKDVRVAYIFTEKSVLQLGFIFAVDRKNITRLDCFGTAIDLSTTAPGL